MSKPKDFSELAKQLSKMGEDLKARLLDQKLMNEIGKDTVEDIKKRTKLGYGVSEFGGSKKKLDSLADSYQKQRKRDRKNGTLSGTTSPAKSNLTRSGDMLDDLEYQVGNGEVTIGFGSDENSQKAEYVSKKRPFLNLSDLQIKRISRKVKELISSIFKPKGV